MFFEGDRGSSRERVGECRRGAGNATPELEAEDQGSAGLGFGVSGLGEKFSALGFRHRGAFLFSEDAWP